MIRARQAISLTLLTAAVAAVGTGCGSEGIEVKSRGAQLFAERCSGCHTLKAAGARGSILGERPTGPNLNKRKLTKAEVLFAIRNGGFSGAIMPQNVVLGADAEAVADFVSKYAGKDVKGSSPAPAAGESSSTSSTAKRSGAGDKKKSAAKKKKKKGNR